MKYRYLDGINSVADVKALSQTEVDGLCDEIRDFLVEKTKQNGGHLASNLGVVELSVALHRVFDSPDDHIIFDVGHQCYIHKLLTGRRDEFATLRVPGGLSGFTSRRESEHDPFGAGHSSTSISAALGFAQSDKLNDKNSYSVAIVGDGAFTGGMIHEALNNCTSDLRLIVVLNENGMSISTNKGAFASYLSKVRASKGYITIKNNTRSLLNRIPLIGKPIARALSAFKNFVKTAVYSPNYFEELGLYYIGVVDGNDERKVERALRRAKELDKCVVLHIKTKKGKGMDEAETDPETFHSVANKSSLGGTYHSVFAEALIDLAKQKDDLVAVTAAMGIGTGLSRFENDYPERYFDVGIAESHALTFTAGLAAAGLKPFVAIYSTFLQRGYDNIIHDIALQNLPVKMFIDRAGLAVSDGATHHGIFDVSFLSHIPCIEILAPSSYKALRECVDYAYNSNSPVAVRYPNSSESEAVNALFVHEFDNIGVKLDFCPQNPPKNIFLTYGSIVENVVEAKKILSNKGIDVGIVLIERIKPYLPAIELIERIISDQTHFVYVEEGIKNGGAAMITRDILFERGSLDGIRFDIVAIDDNFANPTQKCDLYDHVGMSPRRLSEHFLINRG